MANPKNAAWYGGGLGGVLEPGANLGGLFYVDGTGPDTNDGLTPETPLATFLAALALCTSGVTDTIVVLDYWAAAGEAWPIVCDKSMVSIIGVPGGAGPWPQINVVGDFAAFSIEEHSVKIDRLSVNGGATHGAIEQGATAWGTEISRCWFGEAGTCQDGIRIVTNFDAPYLKIWGCHFGAGITRDGVRMDHNATRGMIGVPGKEANWFRAIPGIAINIVNQFAQGGIFDNRISIPADTAGDAINIALGAVGIHIDGNSAAFGETAAAHNNPYIDGNAADLNTWGRNYWNEALSVPG